MDIEIYFGGKYLKFLGRFFSLIYVSVNFSKNLLFHSLVVAICKKGLLGIFFFWPGATVKTIRQVPVELCTEGAWDSLV